MIKFENILTDVAELLKDHGVKETDLFNHHSDLYVGCSVEQANKIKADPRCHSTVETFWPQAGSDMEQYKVGLDFPFSYCKP